MTAKIARTAFCAVVFASVVTAWLLGAIPNDLLAVKLIASNPNGWEAEINLDFAILLFGWLLAPKRDKVWEKLLSLTISMICYAVFTLKIVIPVAGLLLISLRR